MSIRTVRLDDDAESTLAALRQRTGLSVSEVLKRGLQAYAVAVRATAPTTPYEVYRRLMRDSERDEAADLLPQGTPIARAFWESPTLEELARSQNVQPMADVRALFGTWPSAENDGFEETIDELRHSGAEKSKRP